MRQLVLLESGHRRPQSPSGAGIVSIGLHAAVVVLAVLVTAQPAREAHERDSATRIYFASPSPTPSAPAQSAAEPPSSREQPAAQPRFPQLNDVQSRISADIPDVLPPLGATLFDPSVIRKLSDPPAGLTVTGENGLAIPGADGAYRRNQVEVTAAFLPNQQPDYPELLLRDGIPGRVRVRFVVGASGRVQGRPQILAATHPAFAASVHSFLARARYRPARIGGTPVAQLVEQEFVFSVKR